MKRIYVASSWRNEYQPGVVTLLRALGYEVYDFRRPSRGPGQRGVGFSWSEVDEGWQNWSPAQWRNGLTNQRAREGFAADYEAMNWADTCVLVLPSGRSAHAEAGWMAGQGKDVIAYIPEPTEPDLMYLLFTAMAVDQGELIAALAGMPRDPFYFTLLSDASLADTIRYCEGQIMHWEAAGIGGDISAVHTELTNAYIEVERRREES